MNKQIRENWIELAIIVISFIDLFVNVIPPVPLAAFSLLLLFLRLDVLGIILICVFAAPKLAGAIFLSYNIPGIGGALILIPPLLVVFECFLTKKLNFTKLNKVLPALLLLFGYMLVSSIFMGLEWSWSKLLSTIINGVVALLAYTTIFSNYQKCNFVRTGLYFLIISVLLLLLSPIFNHGSGPENLLDFGYLRVQNNMFGDEEVSRIIEYQQVGFIAVLGLGTIMLEEFKGEINSLFLFIVMQISTFASLYAGARQFFVVSLLLIVIWTLFGKKGKIAKFVIPLFSFLFVVLLVLVLFSSEGLLNNVLTDGYLEASKREDHINQGLKDFFGSPVFGIGYGCFKLGGQYGSYPHNLIVELLGELGLVGFLLFFIPLIRPTWAIVTKIRPCFYLMVVYFMRAMASGGLDTNIIFFCYVLASYTLYVKKSSLLNNKNNNIILNAYE